MKTSLKKSLSILGNRPVAVLGGGPNLQDDFLSIPDDSVLVAVNHHCQVALKIIPDVIVFCDHPNRVQALNHAVNQVPYNRRLSILESVSGMQIDTPVWYAGFSSTLAAWFSCWITDGPVYLCGMDCYSTGKYADGSDSVHQGKHAVNGQLDRWRDGILTLRMPERIVACSGPICMLPFGNKMGPL